MNKKKIYWLAQIIGWTLYAIINSFLASIFLGNQNTSSISYVPLFTEAIFFLLATHIFRLYAKKNNWIGLTISVLSFRVFVCAIFIGVAIYFLRVGMSGLLGLYDPRLLSFANVAGNTFPNTLVVFIWSLFYFIFQYFQRYNQSLKHEAEFHQMELNNLKSQLNPHFIFNSLNGIRALVDENPAKSKRAITQLSNILRNTLATDKKRVARFEEELNMVKDYLSLETIRYEERLQTEIDIHPDSYKFNLPPLMMQTLVENGIKHGISKLKEGGKISIKTVVDKGKLKLLIRNSGKYVSKNGSRVKGLGIDNTKKRLKLIFGEEAQFKIKNDNNTVLTEVIIPKASQI